MTLDFTGRSLEDSARIDTMKAAWDAYFGRFLQPLQNRPRKGQDAVIVNRCRPIVDKGVAFLFGKEVTFQVPTDAGDDTQDWLDACWKANRKMTLLQKIGINGAVCGHVFVKLVPAKPYPRLIALDPTMVSVTYAPDDRDDVTGYTIEYSGTNGEGHLTDFRQCITRADSGISWDILDQVKQRDVWVTTDATVWPYAFPPIASCQNLPSPNEYWGLSDLPRDMIQLNKDLNLVLSNVQRIIKYHAHPKTWVTGLASNKIATGPDETLVLPEGAQMGALEMQSDLSSSLNFASVLQTAMDVLSRTPNVSVGDVRDLPRGAISGAALEILLAPLLEKIEAKRLPYGDMLEDVCRRLLILGGYPDPEEIYIHWPDILPEDAVSEATVAQAYLALGVSKETVFERLGLDWNEEKEKLAAEAAEAAEDGANAPEEVVVQSNTLAPTTPESPTDPNENDTAQSAPQGEVITH